MCNLYAHGNHPVDPVAEKIKAALDQATAIVDKTKSVFPDLFI